MIGETDCPCSLNETEFFEPVNKQIILDKSQWVDIYPLNNLTSNGPIEFNINGSGDELLDFNNTRLDLQLKIVNAAGNANLKTSDIVAPINNWFHSCFSDVILNISGTQVEGGNQMYPYKAYLTNLLVHGKESKNTFLQAAGWYKDTAEKMNVATNNEGFTARQSLVATSATVELSGPLLLDFFLQNKYALHNMDISIKLIPSKPEFQTMILTPDTVEGRATAVKVTYEKAVLHVRRVKPLPSAINNIEENLNRQNSTHPHNRTQMITYTVPQGQTSHNRESLFRGHMPKLIIVGFVANKAYNGSYDENPFNFQNLGITQLALYREGEAIPFRPLTPDFDGNKYTKEYVTFLQSLDLFNNNEGIDITLKDYKSGYTLFGFNLTPDLNIVGHAQPIRDGNLRLEVQFKEALANTVNVICMGIFDGKLEITKYRNVLMDWKN